MPRNSIIPFSLLILITVSCSISHTSLSILMPAEIVLPDRIKRLSIFPIVMQISDKMDSLRYLKPEDIKPAEINKWYLYGIADVLSVSPGLQKAALSDTVFGDTASNGKFYWDELKALCHYDTTDFILVLEKAVNYDFPYIRNERYRMGGYTIIANTKWTFYQPADESIAVSYNFIDTVLIGGDLVPLEIHDILSNVCYEVGKKAGNTLVPHWQQISRLYFTGPGRSLRKAGIYVSHNQWINAGKIWNELAQNDTDQKTASRAAFNIALAYEKDDDLKQAFNWIAYADSLHSDSLTSSYKRMLNTRIKHQLILDEQLH
jgi:hypothetical protein